jgi:hypothetical protein
MNIYLIVNVCSRGSVLVDYYLNLNGTTILDTGEIRNYFHMSLDKEGENFKLGNYTVDTKSTDFIGITTGARDKINQYIQSIFINVSFFFHFQF